MKAGVGFQGFHCMAVVRLLRRRDLARVCLEEFTLNSLLNKPLWNSLPGMSRYPHSEEHQIAESVFLFVFFSYFYNPHHLGNPHRAQLLPAFCIEAWSVHFPCSKSWYSQFQDWETTKKQCSNVVLGYSCSAFSCTEWLVERSWLIWLLSPGSINQLRWH